MENDVQPVQHEESEPSAKVLIIFGIILLLTIVGVILTAALVAAL